MSNNINNTSDKCPLCAALRASKEDAELNYHRMNFALAESYGENAELREGVVAVTKELLWLQKRHGFYYEENYDEENYDEENLDD